MGRLFGKSDKTDLIAASFKYSGIEQTEKQHLSIDMDVKEPGLYNLSLTVTDLNSNQKIIKDRQVRITDAAIDYLY